MGPALARTAAPAPTAGLGRSKVPFAIMVLGDSTWRRLPEVEYKDGLELGSACTPGGSLTMSKWGKPPAFWTLLRLLAGESPGRRLRIFGFPLQGGSSGLPSYARKYANRVMNPEEGHMLCHTLARFLDEPGAGRARVWEDSIHPTLESQEHLRLYGARYAPL